MEIIIDRAGRIGQKQDLRAHHFHQTNGKHYIFHSIAFIVMNPSLHNHYRNFIYISEYKTSLVSAYG